MRKRYYLSFDMDNPRHRKAEALIASQGGRQRTGYVVECILAARQSVDLDQLFAGRSGMNCNAFLIPSGGSRNRTVMFNCPICRILSSTQWMI